MRSIGTGLIRSGLSRSDLSRSGLSRSGPARVGLSRSALAVTLLIGVGGLAACGSSGSGSSGSSAPAASSAASSGGGAAPAPSDGGADAASGPFASAQNLSDAVAAAVRRKGSVLITIKAGTSTVRESVQLVGGHDNRLIEISSPGQQTKSLLVVGDALYAPIKDDVLGKHWLHLKLSDAMTSWRYMLLDRDLVDQVGSWGKASLSGGTSGTAAGESVRTYSLAIGPEAAAAGLRADRLSAAEKQSVSKAHYTLTLTLGPDSLPRSLGVPAASGGTTVHQYSRWGAVTVPVPAAKDILDA